MASRGTYKGNVKIIVASGKTAGGGMDESRTRTINTLQCICFVIVSVLVAVASLVTGNPKVALITAAAGIACIAVKVVLMRAWLRYSAR